MVNREAKRDVTVSKDALLKSYSKRLKDDVRSLADNFSAIVKTCRSPALLFIYFVFFEVIFSSELKRSTRLVGPHKLKRMLLRCRSLIIRAQ